MWLLVANLRRYLPTTNQLNIFYAENTKIVEIKRQTCMKSINLINILTQNYFVILRHANVDYYLLMRITNIFRQLFFYNKNKHI